LFIVQVSAMRSVLFVDPPAFCTTLEELVAPALRSRPLAIASPNADRAPLLALSVEARRGGLCRGMPIRIAQRLCPDLIILPPNPQLYARASRALHEILRTFAPTIEPRGYGHAFLDLTGTGQLFGPAEDVAARIRRAAQQRLRLPLSVGIASNKLVSQAAIRAGRLVWGKAPDSGTTSMEALLSVPGGGERGFLAPQPLEVLPELHDDVRARLDDYQLELIGEVAAIPEDALCAVFGTSGRLLSARARGIDPRPVLPPEYQAEFCMTHTLATDTNDLGVLHPLLRLMTQRLGHRLRRRGLTARRLRLDVTYADYTTAVRSAPLAAAVLDAELWAAAQQTYASAVTKRIAVRTLALALDRLVETESQLELWKPDNRSEEQTGELSHSSSTEIRSAGHHNDSGLQRAIDRIHIRYGSRALTRGQPLRSLASSRSDYQATTTFPNVAFSSRARWASAS
jgi:DNA polymerase-4